MEDFAPLTQPRIFVDHDKENEPEPVIDIGIDSDAFEAELHEEALQYLGRHRRSRKVAKRAAKAAADKAAKRNCRRAMKRRALFEK